jgi:hypothetical protein
MPDVTDNSPLAVVRVASGKLSAPEPGESAFTAGGAASEKLSA